MGLETVILWIVLSLMVGAMASSRGNSFFFGFLWSIILSPLIGLVIVLVSDRSDGVRRQQIEKEERMRAEIRAEIERERAGQTGHGRGWPSRARPPK